MNTRMLKNECGQKGNVDVVAKRSQRHTVENLK